VVKNVDYIIRVARVSDVIADRFLATPALFTIAPHSSSLFLVAVLGFLFFPGGEGKI
jgi:hypothetical protein